MSLADKHPYWVDMDDLLRLFPKYGSKNGISQAIRRGTFPVHTFRLGKHRYADKEALARYFRRIRAEAIALEEAASK